MAQAKTGSFDPAIVRTAALAKALAHPVRIRILEILASRRACICGCLVDRLPLAQSTVSRHLGELRDAGLIRGDVDGPRTCYCLDPKTVAEAGAAFADVFRRLREPLGDAAKGLSPDSCRPRPAAQGTSRKSGSRSKPKAKNCRKP
jgi:DNA-binding transcriptional ArsR family regulator